MKNSGTEHKAGLSSFLDYFIPPEIRIQPDAHRRARMFMLSHVFGPFLGNVIPLYLHFVNHLPMDWVFFASVTVFWVYPFVLRATKQYQALAFLSVQNLVFCILWACYSYGGICSPFLPWALTMPVLAFLYLPATGMIRNILLTQIYGSFAIFCGMVIFGFRFPAVDLPQFQLIGIVSTISAAIYVSMMALYFANVFREQGEFERELGSLLATADNLRNLTDAATAATAAKADFVASMSHELRTPLNAVIGYSQLLLDDAADEGNDDAARDLNHIYSAGTQLLGLVDDILDFSKIEANKMVVQVSSDGLSRRFSFAATSIRETLKLRDYDLTCTLPEQDIMLNVDWQAVDKAVSHLIAGVAADGSGGTIAMTVTLTPDSEISLRVVDPVVRAEQVNSERLFDIFSDESDASASKYGSAGISLALSLKFAQLIGGAIAVDSDAEGHRVFTMTLPTCADTPAKVKAAA